jgi:hypothetical protein
LTPEETTNTPDGMTYTGIIREYIPPIGGNNTLVVIDGGSSGLKVISVHQSQINPVTRNFPVGSAVVFTGHGEMINTPSGSPERPMRKKGALSDKY